MDYNALVIGQEQLNAAYNLERAEKSAATAKASALKAQATAKALIADTIKTAQDAAATAVYKNKVLFSRLLIKKSSK